MIYRSVGKLKKSTKEAEAPREEKQKRAVKNTQLKRVGKEVMLLDLVSTGGAIEALLTAASVTEGSSHCQHREPSRERTRL